MFRTAMLTFGALTLLAIGTTRAEDLDTLIKRTTEKIAGGDSSRIPDTERALRLLAAYTRLMNMPLQADADMKVPPEVAAPDSPYVRRFNVKNELSYNDVLAELAEYRRALAEARREEFKEANKTYMERWEAILKSFEAKLDKHVKLRENEDAFHYESISSFADLKTFVRDNQALRGVNKATLDAFMASSRDTKNSGLVTTKPFLVGKKPVTLPTTAEKWWLHSARYGLGEIEVSFDGNTFTGKSKHINGHFNGTIGKDGKGGKGRWSGSGADKSTCGGDLVFDVNDDGSLTLLLYLDGSKTPNTTWTIWYADPPRRN